MAESMEHQLMVRKMYKWVTDNLLNGDGGCIKVDLPEVSNKSKPPSVEDSFIPDLYAFNIDSNVLIIGEAKTLSDFEKSHSIFQYKSFIHTCALHNGKAIFILTIPWQLKARANNLLKNLLRLENVNNIELIIRENN